MAMIKEVPLREKFVFNCLVIKAGFAGSVLAEQLVQGAGSMVHKYTLVRLA